MGGFEAIPQVYAGLNLNSQLEKGAIAFMKANKWNFEYEPEGYREKGIYYRPDILLHGVNIIDLKKPCQSVYNTDVFIEVKGDRKRLKDAYEKAEMMQRNGFHVLIVGKFPNGQNEKEIIDNLRSVQERYWEGSKPYQTYTLFLSRRECGGTPSEREACERSFLRDPNPREKYDPEIWDGYYNNLKKYGFCPMAPKVITNKYLWVGRNGEPIIGTWHSRSDRLDGDPGNTAAAIKFAQQNMSYKIE